MPQWKTPTSTAALVILLLTFLCQAAFALNLLINPGFEDGTAYDNQSANQTYTVNGWTYRTDSLSSGFWNGAETSWGGGTRTRTGGRSVRVFHYGPVYGYPEGWRSATISQTVDVLPNQDYTASAWAFIYLQTGYNIGSQFAAGIMVEELNSSGLLLIKRESKLTDASADWRQLSLSFRTRNATAKIRFTLTNKWLLTETQNHINWDDCLLAGPSPHIKVLQGTVSSGGSPVSGAKVTAADKTTASGADGSYSFEFPVDAASATVRVQKDGCYTQRKYRDLALGATTADFDLISTGDNILVNPGFDDDPYAGGWVEETSGTGNCLRRGEWDFIRNGVGLTPYYVSGEEAICFLLDPANPSGLWYRQKAPVIGGRSYTAKIKTRVGMASGATSIWGNTADQQVAGLLIKEYDSSGNLLRAHPLVKSSESAQWQQLSFTFTTNAGTASVRIGPYAWMTEGSRDNWWWRRVTFDDVELRGELGAFGLSGTIKSGSPPIEGASVEVIDEDGQVSRYVTDTSGRYNAAVSYGGKYTVNVSAPGYHLQSGSATINGMEALDFNLFPVDGNLLFNPAFDEPDGYLSAGWKTTGDAGVWEESSMSAFGPTHLMSYPRAAAIVGWGSQEGRIYQEAPVKPAAVYTARVRFLACTDPRYGSLWGTDPHQKAGLYVKELDGQGNPIGSEHIVYADVTTANRDQWKTLTIQITTNSNTRSLQVGGYAFMVDDESVNLARAIFDNFELTGPPAGDLNIRAIRTLPDASQVRTAGSVVSARYTGFCYIQAPDRSSGIRLERELEPGEIVDVLGAVGAINGERTLFAQSVIRRGRSSAPQPLGISQKNISSGLSPFGLYIRAWGRVISTDWVGGVTFIDDGSGTPLKVYGKASPGRYVQVTGALGNELSGDRMAPVVRAAKLGVYESGSETSRTDLKAAFVLDDRCKKEANQAGKNYWWSYISEILDRLGLNATQLQASELPSRINEFSVLFLGPDEEALADDAMGGNLESTLEQWVSSGGTLVASRTQRIDGLLGNTSRQLIPQSDDFSPCAEFSLSDSSFTTGIHSPLHPDEPLLSFGQTRTVTPSLSQGLAESNGETVITARSCGSGWAFYFGFDLGQTFWVIQQGRPVYADYDGDGYLRSGDAIAIGDHNPQIGYTDELLFLLQNMVSVQPYPLIHQLPANNDTVPDAVLFYGGDDECGSGIQLPAAQFMASRGLPYHINSMPLYGSFGVSPSEITQAETLGTEFSLHFDFMDGFTHPGGFTMSDVNYQTQLFYNHFGRLPVCTVNHWTRWYGWAEPAQWMMDAGIKGDNGHIHVPLTTANPTDCTGFAFGTSYPFHYWTDHNSGNRRLDFIELPITGYELGYSGSVRDFARTEEGLYLASYYQLIFNFFYHPVYIAQNQACRDAIDWLLYRINLQGLNVLHSTPDMMTDWWTDRSEITLTDVRFESGRLSFRANKPSPGSFVVKAPLGPYEPAGVPYPHAVKEAFGNRWLMIVLPEGETLVQIDLVKGQLTARSRKS